MFHYVYMLISLNCKNVVTYIGYSNDPLKRLNNHNKEKGAKFTKGRQWKIIFKKKLINKNDALKFEYFLKKNTKLRNSIKYKYLNKHIN